jgi:protein-S-isoprenylcysteine O-methyltransferase Ste14
MIVKLVVQTVAWLVLAAVLLFWAAGTVLWTAGWIYLALTGLGGLGMGLWLARTDPELLKQRLAPPVRRGQKPFDKVFMVVFLPLYHAWLPLMALDCVRFGWSHVPGWLRFAGVLFMLAGYVVVFFVFRVNTFAAPVVAIQAERRQKVVDTGPYAVVRHPMYAGGGLIFVGTPLLLGSWWGLTAAAFFIPLVAVRAVLEERALARELEGYEQYTRRVRYRLVPGLW